jgi:two-component system KDP operon response regulator KdpE
VKPFSPAELTARVGAALRKRTRPGPFVVADLAIDYEKRRVSVGGRPVRLTVKEYELLRVLSINAGRVMTYESLLRQIWEDREDTEPVRTFVKKLRGKLGDDPVSPAYIFNERGGRLPHGCTGRPVSPTFHAGRPSHGCRPLSAAGDAPGGNGSLS